MAQASKVIATAGVLTVGVETVNAIGERKLPTTRFLIGSGVAYLLLSALAEIEPEIAKALAIGIATTVILSDEGAALKKISGIGDKSEDRKVTSRTLRRAQASASNRQVGAPAPRAVPHAQRPGMLTPYPGIPTTGR